MCLWYIVDGKVSDNNLELWIDIKFCLKSVFEWCSWFKEGQENVQDDTESRKLTKLVLKNDVFWDVTPCASCKNRRFGRT
jgi:hypothetical protein